MTVDTGELKQTLDFAVGIAREAGAITLRYFKTAVVAERKADNSFVTIADREAERFLRRQIEQTFPDDAILGEEELAKPGTSGRRWILDPIDGTYSFVHGVPLYAVLIGLEINEAPVIGVVNLPALEEIVYAASGLGCYWNERHAGVSIAASLVHAFLLCRDFGEC